MDWLCTLIANSPQHCGFLPDTVTAEALREGFWDLRIAFRSLGIINDADLRTWMVNNGRLANAATV
eukprot:3428444-Pyramimonas_sp.AAC.1